MVTTFCAAKIWRDIPRFEKEKKVLYCLNIEIEHFVSKIMMNFLKNNTYYYSAFDIL